MIKKVAEMQNHSCHSGISIQARLGSNSRHMHLAMQYPNKVSIVKIFYDVQM
jgi:hypothetical protein